MNGRIEFECSDQRLTEGFAWAKQQALSYVHDCDPVGPWYEAALPTREAFCMRDVSHQARGAHLLGLERHTKNMLLRFAQSISESRDFCCFWEINRYYRPAPVDYKSDDDFWYNLPANFDVLDACFRMYQLTGDPDYIQSHDFMRFYNLTINDYIKKWDTNGDGIPDAPAGGGYRGIPSYNESSDAKTVTMQMLDLLTAQQRAYRSYAALKKQGGDCASADACLAAADRICKEIDKDWWDGEKNCFYAIKRFDGTFQHVDQAIFDMPLYFGGITDPKKLQALLNREDFLARQSINVECRSYLPEVFYHYGENTLGEYWLRTLIDPDLHRREYPEVSFAVVADYIFELMGIEYHLENKTISVHHRLPSGVTYAAVRNLPVYGREADVMIENGISSIHLH